LQQLVSAHPGKVHIVRLVSSDQPENEAVVKEIQRIAGRLDVGIANAGISRYFEPSVQASSDGLRKHFEVYDMFPPSFLVVNNVERST
jgi:NAD(P)-dependent dehydrogenase (short-subunit alcohol dehydrogenase family)